MNGRIRIIVDVKIYFFFKYLQTKSVDDKLNCKEKCAIKNRKFCREAWNKYVSNIGYDIHGARKKALKIQL